MRFFAGFAPFVAAAAFVAELASIPIAHAKPGDTKADDSAAAPADADERLRQAKAFFLEGNALRKAGDLQGALEFYLRSRKLVPSMPNTMNAAFCLQQLGRLDEVLDLYEEILTKFRDSLGEQETQQLSASMSTLRRKLGSLDVSGNVGGMLLVDGKIRGTLPLVAPVRVLPGAHTVRVFKEGWEPFETRISVESNQSIPIDVKLKPLLQAGRLRVESDNVSGGDLVLDGAPLGHLPWEGTLAPGPHLFFVRKGTLGSSPAIANVVQEQTVVVAVHGVPIGPDVRVVVEPPTADIWIDRVPIGKGQWRGPLPIGDHVLEARELGYASQSVRRAIGRSSNSDIQITLPIDPNHPRWATARRSGTVRLDILGGAALGLSLGGDTSAYCSHAPCAKEANVTGFFGGIRGAYVLPSGVFADWGAGYMSVSTSLLRRVDSSFEIRSTQTKIAVAYDIQDSIKLSGPFFTAGVGYAIPLGTHFAVHGALDVGLLIATVRDAMSGTGTAGGRTLDLSIDGSGAAVHSASPFLLPEIGIAAKAGGFELSLGVAAAIFPLDGPSYRIGEFRVYGGTCREHPGAVDCAPGVNTLARERAFGQFVMALPTLSVGHKF